MLPELFGRQLLFVDGTNGSDSNTGKSIGSAKKTIQAAVNVAAARYGIVIAPGSYNESVTIGISLSELILYGIGHRQAAGIAPSGSNKTALTIKANGVALHRIDCAGTGTGAGARVSGKRFHAYKCKFEGDGTVNGKALVIGPGSAADNAAVPRLDNNGSDSLVEDCEFAWSDIGLFLQGSDYGATTENHFIRCFFHDNAQAAVEEGNSGGDAAHQFLGLQMTDCVFLDGEAAATAYLLLNDSNSNLGIVTRCSFPAASNAAKVLGGTGVKFVQDYFTGGPNTAAPT